MVGFPDAPLPSACKREVVEKKRETINSVTHFVKYMAFEPKQLDASIFARNRLFAAKLQTRKGRKYAAINRCLKYHKLGQECSAVLHSQLCVLCQK